MSKPAYTAPAIESMGSFDSVTNGVWFGSFRDVFGGRAFVAIVVG